MAHYPRDWLPRIEVESLGYLDPLRVDGQVLTAEGCVGSFVKPLDGFRVFIGGEPSLDVSWEAGLPRSVANLGWGGLMGADRSGFCIRARLPPGQRHPGELVTVLPTFGGRVGAALSGVTSLALPMPPEEFQSGIGGYFLQVAFEFLGYFIQRARLEPHETVLDVGCGVGRMAFALSSYLERPARSEGFDIVGKWIDSYQREVTSRVPALAPYLRHSARYEGFDIVGKWIGWCQREITSRVPAFKFSKVSVYNHHYNPEGKVAPEEFIFPYRDRRFDFAIATSLFTHLRSEAARRYLQQIGRVLRPGGRLCSTWFLFDQEARQLVAAGKAFYAFLHSIDGGGFAEKANDPEYAVAFSEGEVESWHFKNGLRIVDRLPGSWCRRPKFVSFQDILIAEKAG